MDDIMHDSQMIVDTFTMDGIMLPKCRIWYRWTDRKNLIFAVREVPGIPWDSITEDIYFRFYSNAYFNYLRKNLENDFILVKGDIIDNRAKAKALMDFRDTYINARGHLFIYVNGIFRRDLVQADLTLGNVVELVYDSTIYKKGSLKLTDLRTFDSILDLKRKYLIAYDSNVNNTIDFHDDIDFFITRHPDDVKSKWQGVYYHRVQGDAVRQITHRDYSLVIPYVIGFINHNNQHEERTNKRIFDADDDIYIDFFIRRGGRDKDLVYNSHKTHELFKLPFSQRVSAMLGIRSNVTEWRADNLELSDYTRIIATPDVNYDSTLVEKAYGYHSISDLVGHSPSIKEDIYTQGLSKKVILYHNQNKYCSHWEYDSDGLLITYSNTSNSCDLELVSKDTAMVEHVIGNATHEVGGVLNPETVSILPHEEFRVYRCKTMDMLKPLEWQDITSNRDNYFEITTDNEGIRHLTWTVDNQGYTTLVRKDNQVLAYSLEKALDNGIIDLYLSEIIDVNNQKSKYRMLVPRGHLDIYLNGHALIRNIDYFVDFPRVVIVAKNYFTPDIDTGAKQRITVRFHGFCNSDMTLQNPSETGYIQFNKLSYNKKYNLKDDKVLNFIIGGAVYDRHVLGFSEDHTECTIPNRDKSLLEGQPYQIKDIIVPMQGLTKEDTYSFRDKSIDTESRISDYMTPFMEEDRSNPNIPPIKRLYPLYSPFISWILDDIRKGTFNFPLIDQVYSDNDLLKVCKPYEWLLKFDPVYQDKSIDYQYVIVHPIPHYSVIDISKLQYKMLSQITRLYMKDKVVLSHFVRIN